MICKNILEKKHDISNLFCRHTFLYKHTNMENMTKNDFLQI